MQGHCVLPESEHTNYVNLSYFIINFKEILYSKIKDLSFFTYLCNGFENEIPLINIQLNPPINNGSPPNFIYTHWNMITQQRRNLFIYSISAPTN